MPTTQGNRKILDPKRWEFMTPAPVASGLGMMIASSHHFLQRQLYITSTTVAYIYNPGEDGWVLIPSPGLPSIGAGACAASTAWSTGNLIATAGLTAIGGNTNSIDTILPLARDLRGYPIHILSGPNAGQTLTIRGNQIGPSATIYVDPQGLSFSNATGFRLMTPTWFVLANAVASGTQFRKYDFATNQWVSLISNIAVTPSVDGKLVTTPSWTLDNYNQFSTGTISATISGFAFADISKNWVVNQWANYQVRIVSGSGAGLIRTIVSNTASVITISQSFTGIQPNTFSTYSIEGNDDFIYNIGNGAVTLYRYSISGNTWSTITPLQARAAAAGAGVSAHWITGVTVSGWNNENGGTGPNQESIFTPAPWRGAPTGYLNGRYIYSFRGGASAILDVYDIPANRWIVATYAPQTETFTTGTKYSSNGRFIWIQKEATGRWFQFDVVTSTQVGWNTMLYTQGAAVVGDTAFDISYVDGATKIVYVYILLNTSTVMLRQMVI
jgi:hypothetical protein